MGCPPAIRQRPEEVDALFFHALARFGYPFPPLVLRGRGECSERRRHYRIAVLDEVARLLYPLRLAGKTDDDVGGDGDAGARFRMRWQDRQFLRL